jgi:hypothetical protein
MRPLIIDAAARAQAARMIRNARRRPYHIGDPVPGYDPAFVGYFDSYRVVFTFTEAKGITYRHLSISVPSDKYPNPAAAFMIAADLFDFVGWDGATLDRPPAGWIGGVNEKEHSVVLLQELKK